MNAPLLRQNVKWGERYVSSGLNKKFAGIITPGVYHGFRVKPGGVMKVFIDHDANYPRSVAVVERDGYSLNITMDDPGYVDIPAVGTWYIVIEAFYIETQPGYERVVAQETVEEHHVVLAKVTVADSTASITADMISEEDRVEPNTNLKEELEALFASKEDADNLRLLIAELARQTAAQNLWIGKVAKTGNIQIIGSTGTAAVSPSGSVWSDGVTVAPVTLVEDGTTAPAGAALVFVVQDETL